MLAREVPAIDVPRLTAVLHAIRRQKNVSDWFLEQGNPRNGFFVSGTEPEADNRLAEAIACISQANWRQTSEPVKRIVLRAIYHHLAHDEPVTGVAKRLRKHLAIRLVGSLCFVEVLGLAEFTHILAIAEFRFGRLDVMLKEEGLQLDPKLAFTVGPKPPMAVKFDLAVPVKATKLSDIALRKAEEGLDLLATTYYRRPGETGPPWGLRTGIRVWTWRRKRMHSANLNRPWMEGLPYAIVISSLQANGHRRRKAPADGYTLLPKGDLREALDLAYKTMGAAARLAPNAPSAITRAWTALEVGFVAPEHQRRRGYHAIATRILLAVADQGSLGGPVKLANFYRNRNNIVHSGAPIAWGADQASEWLTGLYSHLDYLAAFCSEQRLSSRKELDKLLRTPDTLAEARDWIAKQRDDLKAGLKSIVPAHQQRAKATDDMWKLVLKTL